MDFSWIMNKDMDIYSISKDNLTNNYISIEGLDKIIQKNLRKKIQELLA